MYNIITYLVAKTEFISSRYLDPKIPYGNENFPIIMGNSKKRKRLLSRINRTRVGDKVWQVVNIFTLRDVNNSDETLDRFVKKKKKPRKSYFSL